MPEMTALSPAELAEAAKHLRKVGKDGFASKEAMNDYLTEREGMIEALSKTVSDQAKEISKFTGLEDTIKALRDELKAQGEKSVRQLSMDDIYGKLGKGLAAAKRRDMETLKGIDFKINTQANADEWKSFDWANIKAPLGSPLTGAPDSGQYIIDPVIEQHLIQDARKQSKMGGLVRVWPMTSKEHRFHVLTDGGLTGAWLTDYGAPDITQDKVVFGPKEPIKAETFAVFTSMLDEFVDDVTLNIDLGRLAYEAFAEAWGQEIDRQVLVAPTIVGGGQFAKGGALRATTAQFKDLTTGATRVVHATTRVPFFNWYDFDDAVLQIPEEERVGGVWIVNETLIASLRRINRNNEPNNPLWLGPENPGPGKLGLYPFVECRAMPDVNSIAAGNTPYAIFVNPKRHLWMGRRTGIEVRTFDQTQQSLLNGQEFIRFRVRAGFTHVADHNTVIMRTSAT